MSNNVTDQNVRDEVLDISRSFILQAPAGSGKTELLTQRILALLAVVKQPESILAITFTRKAAAEMRQRVMDALKAATGEKPNTTHEVNRWQLAQKVLQADEKYQWNLMKNPNRLNLYTIDALSAKLAVAQPLLSQTGTLPEIEQRPFELYRQAAENCLSALPKQDPLGDNIRLLLSYKDNNLESVIELLAQLLAKRNQWLGRFDANEHQFNCQQMLFALEQMTLSNMQLAYELMPKDIVCELPVLMQQVVDVFLQDEKKHQEAICSLNDFSAIKQPQVEDFLLWKSIANMLLVKKDAKFYKKVTKTHGFPTAKDALDAEQEAAFVRNKETITQILEDLKDETAIAKCLDDLRKIPSNLEASIYHPVLTAVVEILPYVAAHLRLVFQQQNKIDFSELSLAAINALGAEDQPSDLALALDYKIEHILVDEFQDTSSPQIKLLRLLTSGWEKDTNKSLFLVGDPMQSIYRFRDANVSLFLKVAEQGIGDIELESKQLSVNFRSNQRIIAWVNQQFEQVMPDKDDIFLSAVSYTHSQAFHQQNENAEIKIFATIEDESSSQLEQQLALQNRMLSIIKQHIQDNLVLKDKQSLAVLVRSKSHVKDLCLQLSREQVAYQAVELVKLTDRMLVQDITRLALALTDLYDSISWLACFRSPWFALCLDDLFVIEMYFKQSKRNYLGCLKILSDTSKQALATLSADGIERIKRLLPILQFALAQKARKPFKKWLLGTFKALGGLNQIELASDFADLEVCVDTIAEFQQGGELLKRDALFDALDELYAAPDPAADKQVQIMTIHKSKGLEFDKVILPQMHKKSGKPDAPLLKWTELINDDGIATHILALSKQTGEENDPLYQFIGDLEKQKALFELQRLLYVAATRAKTQLYGFCCLQPLDSENIEANSDQLAPQLERQNLKPFQGYKSPIKGSFLHLLWPSLEHIEIIGKAKTNFDKRLFTELKSAKNILEKNLQLIANLSTTRQQLTTIFPPRKMKQCDIQQVATHQQIAQEIKQRLTEFDAQTAVDTLPFNENPLLLVKKNYAQGNHDQATDLVNAIHTEQTAAIIGKVIHAQLEWLSQQSELAQKRPNNWHKISRNQLIHNGILASDLHLDTYTNKVVTAIDNCLQDEKARFILGNKTQAFSELVLLSKINQRSEYLTQKRIVDRCFVEQEQRWIIDYKSSEPADGQSVKSFIVEQARQYKPQLQQYADLFRKLEDRIIVAGLYFPMISHLEIVIDDRND